MECVCVDRGGVWGGGGGWIGEGRREVEGSVRRRGKVTIFVSPSWTATEKHALCHQSLEKYITIVSSISVYKLPCPLPQWL